MLQVEENIAKDSLRQQSLEETLGAKQFRSVPLHAKIREALREIALNQFEDGDKFFSEPELIQRFGVSQGTIRHAMLDLTREGLLIRKVPAGTFVCKQPDKVLTIGIFTLGNNSEFIAGLLNELSQQCRARQYTTQIYLAHRHDGPEETLRQIENAPAHERIVLLCNTPKLTRQLHTALVKRGFQTVNVDTRIPGYSGNYVGVDDRAGIRLGLEHLAGLGHRRIVLLVNEPMEAGTIEERVRAFEEIAAARGLAEAMVVQCGTKFGEDSYEAAYQQMDKVLALNPRPTAIFSVSDAGAWAALRRLSERGVAVPQEISVLGFSDDRPSRFMHPALSTIAQPVGEIVRRAIEMLVENLPGTRAEFMPPTLVIRESTAVAPPDKSPQAKGVT
ncbi:MAG: GntR family transcriptional regulator [Verrucomicrobiales bacterium]|nr:GntR family transcriptional regulator [Verrucomicrobiales bacterium]